MTGPVSIPSRAGFLAALDSGVKAVSKSLILQAVTTGNSDWRLGITASKKVGNAVRRNRARRRLRALARTELSSQARPGVDYVIIARWATAETGWDDLVADLGKTVGYLHRTLDRQSADTMDRKNG